MPCLDEKSLHQNCKAPKIQNYEEIMSVQAQCLEKLYDYNMTRPSEAEKRTALLSKRDKSE